ncbi:TadE/TadG family type IV pilus assembly protein [Paraburkholderia sp. JHI2823]|uniref:TadE/TadG family type IV pilus assembly protein n=1 Tax=Paraburkholderia TaxID=1822464 RepID=UPI000421EA6C|nr:TadE/TadG family type IV pilus assembly protein [Paraburkholderia mimosarum]
METAKTGALSLSSGAGRKKAGAASPRRGRGRRLQRGVAAVEFALVLPVLLLLLFGIIEMGLFLYDKAVITNASREGARAGVVLKSPKPTTSDIQTVVTNYTSSYLLTFGTQNTPAVVTTGAGGNFGQPLSVTVSWQYNGLALGRMVAPITGAITMSATTVMNNE